MRSWRGWNWGDGNFGGSGLQPQSGGSRYESGRNIPRPVQLLLTLVYGTDMQVEKLSVALHDWKKKEG